MSRAHDEREFKRSCELLRNALNERNRAEFDAMDIELKRAVIDEAFKDGILYFEAPYFKAIGHSEATRFTHPDELPTGLPCGKSIYGGVCLREPFHEGQCVPDYLKYLKAKEPT